MRKHVKLNGRCKACNLLKQDLQLFDEAHQRLLILKQPQAAVVKWLNGRIDLKNLNRDKTDRIKLFNKQNFTIHLKNHITDQGKFMREIAIRPPPVTHSTFSEVEEATANDVVNKGSDSELDDFREHELTVKTLSASLKFYRGKVQKALDENVQPNRVDVEMTQKTLDHVLESKKVIAQVRNSTKVAGEAVRRMASLITNAFLEKLIEATNEQQVILSQQMEGSLPSELNNMLRNRMGVAMKAVLADSYEKVTTEFGIK